MTENAATMVEKPKRVTLAVHILWVSFFVWTSAALVKWARYVVGIDGHWGDALSYLVVGFVVLLPLILGASILILLYFKIGKGRNWARIVLLVLTILGLPTLPFTFVETCDLRSTGLDFALRDGLTSWDWAFTAVNTFTFFAVVFALYLLFTQPGSSWFHRRHSDVVTKT